MPVNIDALSERHTRAITPHLMFFTAFSWTQFWPVCSPMMGRSVRGTRGALRHIFSCLHCTARVPACTWLHLLQDCARRLIQQLSLMLYVPDT